jgi:hypothetical protein
MFDLAINVAQPLPPAYQLPSLDYEDGNVSGSSCRHSTNHPRHFFSKIEGRSDVVLTTGIK